VAPEYRSACRRRSTSSGLVEARRRRRCRRATASPATSLREVIKRREPLKERRKADELTRAEDTREWAQNREFYKGNQYVFWNRVLNQLEALPVQDGEKPRYKVRLKQNKIRKGVHRWIAQMTKNKPVIFATPDSSSDRDMKAAETAESLFEHVWREQNLTGKLQRGLLFAALSQGYLEVTYDPFAGKQMRHVIDPKTKKPIDGPLAELLLEEIQKQAEATGIPMRADREARRQVHAGGRHQRQGRPRRERDHRPGRRELRVRRATRSSSTTSRRTRSTRGGRRGRPPTPSRSRAQPALLYQKQTDKRPKTVRAVYCGYFKPDAGPAEGPLRRLDRGAPTRSSTRATGRSRSTSCRS
jgi:hypothetical protein